MKNPTAFFATCSTLALLAGLSLPAQGQAKDGAYYFGEIKQAILEVIQDNQPLINTNPDGSRKSEDLTPEKFYSESYRTFKTIMGADFVATSLAGEADPSKIAHVLSTMLQAGRDHCAKLQPDINNEKDGSTKPKKFIPAIFGRLTADKFKARTGAAIKQTTLGRGDFKARNPYNAPDDWETKALKTVSAEGWELNHGFGEKVGDNFRYLKPIYIKQGCLVCHGDPVGEDAPYGHKKEGYKLGEIRGAISISLPAR